MTLAGDPKVLLLDEPLAGMGPEESERLTGLLQGLAREHAVLLIEHDMDFVFAVADWMTVMAEGTVLAERQAGRHPRQHGRARGLSRGACVMPALADRPLLEGRSLDTYYGQSHILRGVSLTVRPGETIGLMGRNGMGKTTLIRTLVGLVRPRRGQVLVDGHDVTRAADLRHRAARHRLRAGGTRHLRQPAA